LETGNVGPGLAQPGREIGQPLVDVVDIEGGDLHFEWSFSHSRKDHSIAGNMDLESAIQEKSPTLDVRQNWI
jgi:hypothetical protein